jgi:hypothetical protein
MSYACTNPMEQMKTDNVTWWLSVSVNSGVTWSHRRAIHDPEWRECLTNQSDGSNRVRASISYDPVSARVLMGFGGITTRDAGGNCVGSRAYLLEWPDVNGHDATDGYTTTCPPPGTGCVTPGSPPGPCTYNNAGGPLPVGEGFCNQYGVESNTIPFSGTSRAAWVWHSTYDSLIPPNPPPGPMCQVLNLQADIWGASYRPGPPVDTNFNTVSRITPIGMGVPWTQVNVNYGNTPWGDYEGMAAGNGQFFAFWGDERNNNIFNTTYVYTSNFLPN